MTEATKARKRVRKPRLMISRIKLKNWRNFRSVDIPLGRRVFLIGPNASGKSNFLDAFRFLRDIAKPEGGGLQKAVADRGGISKIRCLAARWDPEILIDVDLTYEGRQKPTWRYTIGFTQESRGLRQPRLKQEHVWKDGEVYLSRPDEVDKRDRLRLNQTHLEQLNANQRFREIADFFDSINYMHLVPQLIRHPERFGPSAIEQDPFGQSFLERIRQTPRKTQEARIRKIGKAIQIAVPQLTGLSHRTDDRGAPHLEAICEHWRPNAGKQSEEEFSDGTLRLIAFLWSILSNESVLLLEEPELSLHTAIVRNLSALIWRMQQQQKNQVVISTHSYDLLSDKGIGGEETLLLTPHKEGTRVKQASRDDTILAMLESGLSVADAALFQTDPKNIRQLALYPFNG